MDYITEERKKITKKRKRRKNITSIVLLILFFFMTICCLVLLFAYIEEKEKAEEAWQEKTFLEEQINDGTYISKNEADALIEEGVTTTSKDQLQIIRSMMENGDGTLTMLETLFPEMIVVPDGGKYVFFDISDTLKKNNYKTENFEFPILNEETEKYEGEAVYKENGEVTSHKGIDVSKFQGDINWKKVAKDGVEFAFIRLGYRGYETGKIVTDDKYEDNIKGCNAAGIDTGVYFFTEAVSEREAIEEAEYILENIEGYDIHMPIVIDVEESASKNSRTKDLTKEERTACVIAFCERIKEAGYEPMIYGNLKSLMLMLDMEQLEEYEKWFAYYRYPVKFPYQYRIWQYTSTGTVDGIDGNADLNIMFY